MPAPAPSPATLLWRLIGSGQWERALDTARAWLAQDPENTQAHVGAGQALVNLKQYAAARPHLEKALQGNPRNDDAHRLLSVACFHEKDLSGAEEHAQNALALDPQDAGHWYHLAWLRYQCGAFEAAAQHAQRALALRPNDANTVNLLALCRHRQPGGGDRPELLAQYRRALELDPENALVHNNLGTYYLSLGGSGGLYDPELNAWRNLAKAEECFRRALMFDPALKIAQGNLFAVLRRRDPVYRVLVFPKLWFAGLLAWRRGGSNVLARIALFAVCFYALRFLLPLFLLWCLLVWPLVKVYEHLTLGDIRAQAGIVGGRRGGLFGFWRWPFAARFGLFAAVSLLFWGAVGALFYWQAAPDWVWGMAILLGALAWVGWIARGAWGRWRRRAAAKRGEKRLQKRMAAE